MKTKKIFYTILVFILIINLPPLMWLSYFFKENFTYSNYNGDFTCGEWGGKGSSFKGCNRVYDYYIENHRNIKDKTLYRTFTLKPWRFWEWHELYLTPKRFALPYISKEEIRENRIKEGLPVK
jgi:hypothetical protein